MRLVAPLLTVLLALAAPLLATATELPPETVVGPLDDLTCPVLALDPVTHEPHVAYVSGQVLYHAWRAGGTWQTEVVATSVYGSPTTFDGFDLKLTPDGRPVVAYFVTGPAPGVIVAAIREGGVWLADTLDFEPGTFTSPALAVSPLTGEPTVAWGKRPAPFPAPLEIKLARRSAGAWTSQVLDTTTSSSSVLAVAVDLADRPSVLWMRLRADGRAARVLTCGTATAPAGPFEIAPVDSELATPGYFALAVDPVNGEPRVVYNAISTTNQRSVRYAARDGALGWQRTDVTLVYSQTPPPSLALDPAGDPFVGLTFYTPIAPQDIRGGDEPGLGGCIYTSTGSVCLAHREGGAGTGDFQEYDCVAAPGANDAVNAPRSVATITAGVVDVAWRTPGNPACAPFTIHYARSTPFAGVPPGAGTHVALSPVAPNPARLGASLHVAFELAATSEATIELHDVAGRRVAERSIGALPAGPHALEWSPAAPRAGLYWLAVRAGGARLGARPVVLTR